MTVVSCDPDMQTTCAIIFGSGTAGSVTASCVSGWIEEDLCHLRHYSNHVPASNPPREA